MFDFYKIGVKFWLNLWMLCEKNPQSVSSPKRDFAENLCTKLASVYWC